MTTLKRDEGDYLAMRDKLFEGETVDSLWKEMKAIVAAQKGEGKSGQ